MSASEAEAGRRRWLGLAVDGLVLMGVALLVAGVARLSMAAALMVAAVLCVATAWLLAQRGA